MEQKRRTSIILYNLDFIYSTRKERMGEATMNINYKRMESQHVDAVVKLYIDYYNTYEGGCWTYDKAYKRLHQLMTIEDALCFIQIVDHVISGFVMGYFKEFDDLTGYYLEEIVVAKQFQGAHLGTHFLNKLEKTVKANGASFIELLSVNDEMHAHFYTKSGYKNAENMIFKCKHFAD